MKKNISRRTVALLAAFLLFSLMTGLFVTTAAPRYAGDDFVAELDVNHIQIALTENGKEITDRLTLSGVEDKVIPGKPYEEVLGVKNNTKVDTYVRMIVRTYWGVEDENGNVTKTTKLDPDLIKLSYGKADFNTSEWFENKQENRNSEETRTFYRKSVLKGEKTSDLFDTLTVDSKIANDMRVIKTKNQEGKTVITYEYKYSGYRFYVEADVQALQTHNINGAISSKWGVRNVAAEGGKLVLK